MGTLIGLYLSNTQSARFQGAVLRVQENGRFAIDMISRTARMAGHNPDSEDVVITTPLVKGTTSTTGTIITQTGLKTGADTLGVRFQGGTKIRDCRGALVSSTSWVSNQFAVDSSSNLICSTGTNNGTTLAEGVEDMRVWYGLDLTADGYANRYVQAGNVGDWSQVVTIRVAILVNSVSNALIVADNVCLGCSVFNGSTDNLIRAEFQSTIDVRN
jgi:type IV pilus assembly protein PilW